MFKNIYLFVAIILAIVVIASLAIIALFKKDGVSTQQVPIPFFEKAVTPTPYQLNFTPIDINTIPTLPPEKGLGLDTQSKPVKNSISEIEKLEDSLPLTANFNLSTGMDVSIVIPIRKYVTNPWVLPIYISPINFEVSPTEKDYALYRNSFIEAVSLAFNWIRSRGAEPNKIIYSWGEKAVIQERAESWLKGQ